MGTKLTTQCDFQCGVFVDHLDGDAGQAAPI